MIISYIYIFYWYFYFTLLFFTKKEELFFFYEPEDVEAEFVWSSSDESICVVDNGVITTLKGGYVEITCATADGEVSQTVAFKVYNYVSEIKVTAENGDVKKYTIILKRKSKPDTTLKTLTLSTFNLYAKSPKNAIQKWKEKVILLPTYERNMDKSKRNCCRNWQTSNFVV